MLTIITVLSLSIVSAHDADSNTTIDDTQKTTTKDTAETVKNIKTGLEKANQTLKNVKEASKDYTVKNTTELTKTINALNKVKTNQTSTINLKKGSYDNINITWKNRNVKLIINGNGSKLINTTLNTNANTALTINSVTFTTEGRQYMMEDIATNILNKGTLNLNDVKFNYTGLNFVNNKNLRANECKFIDTDGIGIFINDGVAEFRNTEFRNNWAYYEFEYLIYNNGKLSFINTIFTGNSIPSFIGTGHPYNYGAIVPNRISELLFVNSTLNDSLQYRYNSAYMDSNSITIVNSTLSNISHPVDWSVGAETLEEALPYSVVDVSTDNLILYNNDFKSAYLRLNYGQELISMENTVKDSIIFLRTSNETLSNSAKKASTIKSIDNYIKNFIKTGFEQYIRTNIIVNPILNVPYTDNATITINLTDANGNKLKNKKVEFSIYSSEVNNYTTPVTLKTNNQGTCTFTFKTETMGEHEITITKYADSILQKAPRYGYSRKTITFSVIRKETNFTIDKIKTVQYNKNAVITGRYTDGNGVNLTYTPLTLKINGKSYKVTTDANGIFRYTIKATKMGANTVSVSYPGNSRYYGSTATSTFYVGKATKLTLNRIANTVLLDNVAVSGKFTDANGNALRYTPININIADKQYTATTNAYGVYILSAKTTKGGRNTVVASYDGNSRYAAATATGVFNVARKATKLTINSISRVSYSDNVTVRGKFADVSGNVLRYTPVKVSINSNVYDATTDNGGFYVLKARTTSMGTNRVTVRYNGNANYLATSANSTFTVTKKATKISADKIARTCTGDNATIKGTFRDTSGNVLRYTKLTIKVNSKTFMVKTDKNGLFMLKVKVSKIGRNNVTISYAGNNRYKASSVKKIINVVKMKTKITVDRIAPAKVNSKVKVTGKLADKNAKAIKKVNIIITFNGHNYTVKTKNNGVFTYTIKPTITGTNNVTVVYLGSDRYSSVSTKKTFKITE